MLPDSIGVVESGTVGQVAPGPDRKPVLESSGWFDPSPLSTARSWIVWKPGTTTPTFDDVTASLLHELVPIAVRHVTSPLIWIVSGNPNGLPG